MAQTGSALEKLQKELHLRQQRLREREQTALRKGRDAYMGVVGQRHSRLQEPEKHIECRGAHVEGITGQSPERHLKEQRRDK